MKARLTLLALMTFMLVACDDDHVDTRYAEGVVAEEYVPYWPASTERQTRQKDRALLMDAELPVSDSKTIEPKRK
jgi:hypothetical protein